MRRRAINSAVLVKATAINTALSNLRCMYLGDTGPGLELWLDAREHVGKLVQRLDADRDCRTPPPQRLPAVTLDAGTDASSLVERLAADLHASMMIFRPRARGNWRTGRQPPARRSHGF